MDTRHEHFMELALEQARLGLSLGELPVGAVVVCDGEVLAQAHTEEKTQPGRLLVHAELLALQRAEQNHPLRGKRRRVALYTTVEPCLMCLGAAHSFFLHTVHFAARAPLDGACSLTPLPPFYQNGPAIHAGLFRDESIALFQDYLHTISSLSPYYPWAHSIASLAEL